MLTRESFNARQAKILLSHIERVAHWLPVSESNREEVLRDVTQIEGRFSASEPLDGDVLSRLRQHVWELHGGPFKALLVQQVSELGETLEEIA